ncbi:hypothetical protein SUGI_0068450 [Cryptomeria japonica]|nr:hypothetical protein SUGI_0068450 [Cryptomeria japonica]
MEEEEEDEERGKRKWNRQERRVYLPSFTNQDDYLRLLSSNSSNLTRERMMNGRRTDRSGRDSQDSL